MSCFLNGTIATGNYFYLLPCYDGLKCQSIVQNQGMLKMTIEQFIGSISTIPYRSLEKEFDFAKQNKKIRIPKGVYHKIIKNKNKFLRKWSMTQLKPTHHNRLCQSTCKISYCCNWKGANKDETMRIVSLQ